MAITFDFANSDINITAPDTTLTVQALVDAIRSAEDSEIGVTYPQIANASGKDQLASGVQVGITCTLLGSWGIKWWVGNYQASIGGGNLLAASGNPIKYVVGGPMVIVTGSAAATIVTSGSGVLPADIEAIAARVWTNLTGTQVSSDVADMHASVQTLPADTSDALLDRNLAGGSNGGRTVRDALRALRNKTAIVGNTLVVYTENDTAAAWAAAVTTSPRDPLQSVDPS